MDLLRIGLFVALATPRAALAVVVVVVGAIAKLHVKNGMFLNREVTPVKVTDLKPTSRASRWPTAYVIAGGSALSLDGLLVR